MRPIFILVGIFLVCHPIQIFGEPSIEYRIKAAFLYKFAKFVEWPEAAFADSGAITIGILGQDPFSTILHQTIQGKQIHGRDLKLQRFARIEELQRCHILFVSSSEKKRLVPILERLEHTSTLTIGEMENFCADGGIIQFIVKDGKVQFSINVAAARREDLKISSRLLRLALAVYGNPSGEKP